jgi:adenylosuccinate synthase
VTTAKVVIGANWGDEGKGKAVDHYATPNCTVVRMNGGGNAGHTCIHDGKRHVFHHIGSGTFQGASTYLSRFFINNPILYLQELTTLDSIGLHPRVIADPASLITVPFDMMVNQMVEQARGKTRHGSCGVGINETIKRTEAGFSLLVSDLTRVSALRDRLHDIRKEWLPIRLAQLGIKPSDVWRLRLNSDDILDAYVEQCLIYRRQMGEFDWTGDIVFEGAQGLLLDEDHPFFPYVTHSHTGLRNVVALVEQANLALDVTYVTRAYATRHGAGPFPHEVMGLAYEDRTNVPNDWQGQLRFGDLDLDLLAESIAHDLLTTVRPVRHGVAITCLDQVGDAVVHWQHGQRYVTSADDFVQRVCDAVAAAYCLTSDGPAAAFRMRV